jgi:antitoxin component YwqK of YwqJK toxin-antitoxin module
MTDTTHHIRSFISLLIVLMLAILLIFTGACSSLDSTIKAVAITDSDGLASVIVDGQPISISVIDRTAYDHALSEIDVYSSTQQDVQLLYLEDVQDNFFPSFQPVFPPEDDKTDDGTFQIYLAPTGTSNWTMGTPASLYINIDALKKLTSCPYADLGYILDDKYPSVRGVVFLYDEKIGDIETCQVTLYATPFPQVVYVHLQEKEQISGINFMPIVYAQSSPWYIVPFFFTSAAQSETVIIGLVWAANALQERSGVGAFDRGTGTLGGQGVTWVADEALEEIVEPDLSDITSVLPPGANTTATPGQGRSTPVPGTLTDTTASGDSTNTSGGTSDGTPSTGNSSATDNSPPTTNATSTTATDDTNDTTGDTGNTTGSSGDTTESADTPVPEETAGGSGTAQDATPQDNAPGPETQSTTSTPAIEATAVHVLDSRTDTWGYGDYTVTTNIVSYSNGTCTRTSYYDNGQIAEQYTSVWNGYNGPMLVGSPGWTIDGVQSAWYPNGQIADEKYIEDGKLNGTWTQWNEDGAKAREENYKDGKLNGIRTLYWSNGNKRSEALWSNGEIVPESIVYWDWYNNAEPYKMVKFENGQVLEITMDEYWQGSREIVQGPKQEAPGGPVFQNTVTYVWTPVDYGTGRDGTQSTISPADMPIKETSVSTEGGGTGGGEYY